MGTNSAIACAENIAILYLLHSVPAPPTSNPVTSSDSQPPSSYCLPFERERSLCSTLAFISSTNDDPNRIPALCLQECPSEGSLHVLVAVNEAKYGDGLPVLQRIQVGLDRIFAQLSQAPQSEILFRAAPCNSIDKIEDSNVEDEVFAAIVAMCRERILQRLRYFPQNKSFPQNQTVQPIKNLLQDAVKSLPDCRNFIEKSRTLLVKINAWLGHQTDARLQDVVESVQSLWRVNQLQEILDSIPNPQMKRKSRKTLFNMLKKVSRYREAARHLYRTAKNFAIVQHMKVVPVSLPRHAFKKVPKGQPATLLSPLANINLTKRQRASYVHIWPLLGVSELEAGRQITKQRNKTLAEGKIHAEVQLIFYCESTTAQPFPRIISSSKDACFLCNAFIAVHGKCHIPRSHGRLYPGWRLPPFPNRSDLEQRFVQMLASLIRDSIDTMLSRQQKTKYVDPAESTILTLPISTSTLGGLNDMSSYAQAHSSVTATSRAESAVPLPSIVEVHEESTRSIPNDSDENRGTVSQLTGFASQHPTLTKLTQGKPMTAFVKANQLSAMFEAWPISLHVEYSSKTSQSGSGQGIDLCLEWLTGNDADIVRQAGEAYIVEAELLHESLSLGHAALDNFFIRAGESLLRVRIA